MLSIQDNLLFAVIDILFFADIILSITVVSYTESINGKLRYLPMIAVNGLSSMMLTNAKKIIPGPCCLRELFKYNKYIGQNAFKCVISYMLCMCNYQLKSGCFSFNYSHQKPVN